MNINDFNYPYRKSMWQHFHKFLINENFTIKDYQPINEEINSDFENKKLRVRTFMMNSDLGYGLVRFYDKRWRTRPIIIGLVNDWQDMEFARIEMFGQDG
jgi:methionine synthase II (cobalamin-independent)